MLKRERVNHRQYRTRDEARADLFDYLERFHNPRMRRRVARRDREFSVSSSTCLSGRLPPPVGAETSLIRVSEFLGPALARARRRKAWMSKGRQRTLRAKLAIVAAPLVLLSPCRFPGNRAMRTMVKQPVEGKVLAPRVP